MKYQIKSLPIWSFKMSIQEFLKNWLIDKKNLNILEIGCGKNPSIDLNHITQSTINVFHTVDFNHLKPITLFHKHFQMNFLEFYPELKYDLIIDGLCLHEQNRNERIIFLDKIKSFLNTNGIFIGEHAISHKQMSFNEDNLLYDVESKYLYEQKNGAINIVKYIPDSLEIELELGLHFQLNQFICSPTKKIICNRTSNLSPLHSDPDHLFYVLENLKN